MRRKQKERCPNGFHRNRSTGKCQPTGKPKRKRCPNGFHRNRSTGECERIVTRQEKIITRKRGPPKPPLPLIRRKKCPNKTGKCDSKKKLKIKMIDVANVADQVTDEFISVYYDYCGYKNTRKSTKSVSKPYFLGAKDDADYIFFTEPKPNKKGRLGTAGVVFVQELEDEDGINIDVICSKGAGGKLMRHIIEWAEDLDYDVITLHSLMNAINFYRSFGFEFRHGQRKEPKTITKLSIINKDKRFNTYTEIHSDSDYVRFLKELCKKGFGATDSCQPHAAKLKGKKFTDQCLDGFEMRLILP